MWWKSDYNRFCYDYDNGAFERWNKKQKKVVERMREIVGMHDRGVVFCEDEFVKDTLWVEYRIKSERVLDGWYILIN